MGSVVGWWVDSRSGVFDIQRLQPPPSFGFVGVLGDDHVGDGDADLRSISRQPPDDGIVPRAVLCGYRRNYTVQVSTAEGADARADEVLRDCLIKRGEMAIEADYRLGEEITVNTVFADASGADWFVANYRALFGVRREILRVRTHPSVCAGWNIGNGLQLQVNRYDWMLKPVRLIGYRESLGTADQGGESILYLWG